jgi:DNA-binding helix-hairpin-helix protein with protein kinase domain
MPPQVIDENGSVVPLGQELGKGGEGAVYEIVANQAMAAKIYHNPLSADRVSKLKLMTRLRNEDITKLTAWPAGILRLRTNGEPIGLIMPKVSGCKDIHNLYSPKSRRAEFQRADWRFLIRAIANAARAFGAVHASGCVIGDVNHGSILVGQDATVRLIDCDSFQIVSGSQRFLCEVGVETFTPPELQGKPFAGVIRTENHDNFGLAVMAFLTLFMGRHPFAGRFTGPGDMPIPKAIEEFRFAYGSRRSSYQMEQPPGTPPLSIVGSDVAGLFERAFSKEAVLTRPTSREWVAALTKLERNVIQCSASSSHWHISGISCPWCRMESATGITLFSNLIQTAAGTSFEFDQLWRQVEAVKVPGNPPEIPQPVVRASAGITALRNKSYMGTVGAAIVAGLLIAIGLFAKIKSIPPGLFIFGGIVTFFVLRNLFNTESEQAVIRARLDTAKKEWDSANAEWQKRTGSQTFFEKKNGLNDLKRKWDDVPNLRHRKLNELRQQHERLQKEAFLDRFKIESARINGIGSGRKGILASYGIETAADIDRKRLRTIPGFGPALQGALLDWKEGLARKFTFNPNIPIDPSDTAAVEKDILAIKIDIEKRIRAGLVELRTICSQIEAARRDLRGKTEEAYRAYLQAAADVSALSEG